MAGPYTISTVSAGSDDPDPVEWANLQVKPAIEDLHLRSAALETNRYVSPSPKGAGDRLVSAYTAVTAGGQAYATGNVPASMFPVSKPLTIDGLCVRVSTIQSTDGRALLYSSDSDGYPVTLVAEASFSCTVAALVTATLAAPVLLPQGLYWACIRTNAGAAVRFTCLTPATFGVQNAAGTLTGERTMGFDPGTYAAPLTTITSWTMIDPSTNVVPWMALVKAP
jgi:hypothetical protein